MVSIRDADFLLFEQTHFFKALGSLGISLLREAGKKCHFLRCIRPSKKEYTKLFWRCKELSRFARDSRVFTPCLASRKVN